MRRDEILKVLRQFKKEYAQQYGILEIGVFGSLGRDEFGNPAMSIFASRPERQIHMRWCISRS